MDILDQSFSLSMTRVFATGANVSFAQSIQVSFPVKKIEVYFSLQSPAGSIPNESYTLYSDILENSNVLATYNSYDTGKSVFCHTFTNPKWFNSQLFNFWVGADLLSYDTTTTATRVNVFIIFRSK